MKRHLTILIFCAALASLDAPVRAQADGEKPAKTTTRQSNPGAEGADYRISFKMKDHDLEASGNFVVQNGAQANYVSGGETPSVVSSKNGEKGVEFKKHSAIVNCLPVENPNNGRIRAECQFELSGPLAPATELKVHPAKTFQLQTSFEVQKGHTLVLTDEPDRRVEVRIDEVAP